MTATYATEEEIYWLALRLVPGLGNRRLVQALEKFRSPAAVLQASRSELEACGLSGAVSQSVASGCSMDEAIEQRDKVAAAGAQLVPFNHPLYPAQLRQIFDPPALLFAKGRAELLSNPTIGVVGTRRPTPYGIAATERLTAGLVQAGLTVASGMARGIDTAAHRAALAAAGDTIAVFGCGVDVIYPAENRRLAAELGEKGLILSEFPMGYPAHPQNFPIRNRIISGLSAGVLVVEGAQYSGSAITARLAFESGRPVFAVPGNITSKMSWGPNLLIRQGAVLVQDAADVLDGLDPDTRRRIHESRSGQSWLETNGSAGTAQASPLDALGPNAGLGRQILARLSPDTATQIDDLIDSCPGASASEILAVAFELELSGLIRQLPGRNYVKVW